MSTLYEPSFTHPRTPVIKPAHLTKVLSSAGPEQVTTERRLAFALNVSGFKGNSTPNDNTIWIGLGSTHQTWEVLAGKTIVIETDKMGFPIDTEDLFIRGTSGDGVVIEFSEGVTSF